MSSVDSPEAQANVESEALDLNFELRRILNNSLAFVEGQRANESFASTTYEELAQEQNERIAGQGAPGRPNQIERIERLRQEMNNLVAQVRDIPPEKFILSDSRSDVNTPVEPEE